MKTRATSTSACNFPSRRRCNAQARLGDSAGKDVKFLSDNLNKFLVAARKRPEIGLINSTFIPSVPEQYINVDQDKALKQGVAISDVYQTIQAYMGGLFVNYFNDFGRSC